MGVLTGRFSSSQSFVARIPYSEADPSDRLYPHRYPLVWSFGAGKLFLIFGACSSWCGSRPILRSERYKGLIRRSCARHRAVDAGDLFSALPVIMVGLRTSVGLAHVGRSRARGTVAGVFFRIGIAQQNLQTGQVLGGL